MEAAESAGRRQCVECDRPLAEDANVCPNCGHDYRPSMMGHAWEEELTPLAPAGGALLVLSGFMQMIEGLLQVRPELVLYDSVFYTETSVPSATAALAATIVAVIAIVGGTYAMTRRRLAFSLTSGVGAVSMGAVLDFESPLVMMGLVVGLLGALLVAMAREEFID